MAIIYRECGATKQLKQNLSQTGLLQLDSINEIDDFLHSYEDKLEGINSKHEKIITDEIENLRKTIAQLNDFCDKIKDGKSKLLAARIVILSNRIAANTFKIPGNILSKAVLYFKLKRQKKKIVRLEKNKKSIISNSTKKIERRINHDLRKKNDLSENIKDRIRERSENEISELAKTKNVLDENKRLLAGAKGEELVLNELKKLSDEFSVINDYCVKFNPPIYTKKYPGGIHSIQIDHLVISKSGLFIIETKNWSKDSLSSRALNSPIEQVQRFGFALYTMIQGGAKYRKLKLKKNLWSNKKIPIRNLIVMLRNKLREDSQFVKVVQLNQLNGYINYFDPIFDDKELEKMLKFFLREGTT